MSARVFFRGGGARVCFRVGGACAGLAAIALLGAATAAHGAPLCQMSARVSAERALVGEQLLYDLRILRRHDVTELAWDRAPSFPAFRSEWLPGLGDEDPVDREGESYSGYHERRALFPAREGRLEIPAVALRCRTRDAEEIVAGVPLVVFVEPVPSEGRPPEWSGVVGALALSVTVSPLQVPIGEAFRVSVVARGPVNLWDARSPVEPLLAELDVESFARPPELARDSGRALTLRRYWSYDLVPRRAGTLQLGELRVPYFDPLTREYRHALARGPRIDVMPAAPTATVAPEAGARPLPRDSGAAHPPNRRWRRPVWWMAVAGLLGLGFAAWRRGRRPALPTAAEAIDAALAEAGRAERSGDRAACAAALGRALRLGLAERIPDATALTPEELLARVPEGALMSAVDLLAGVERARFEPGAAAPTTDQVRSQLAALHAEPV